MIDYNIYNSFDINNNIYAAESSIIANISVSIITYIRSTAVAY